MAPSKLNWIANFIWGIADDVLRDLYVRGKYRDVILPMTVLRRLDAVLEPTKQAVLDMKETLDKQKVTNQDFALRQASGQAFYNTSKFTLRDLRARTSQQQLRADFEAFLEFDETEQSKVFPNEAFGYWKVTVERPLRLAVDLSAERITQFRGSCEDAKEAPLANVVDRVAESIGPGPHLDFNRFMDTIEADAKEHGVKLTAKRKKLLQAALACRDDSADPVIKKVHKKGKAEADPIRGRYPNPVGDKALVLEYEPDSELRDTEQVPLQEDGGIEAFIRREVSPHAPDAWFDEDSVKVGYEISFNRYFYKPEPLRSLEEIRTDILALEKETEGLLVEIVGEGAEQ